MRRLTSLIRDDVNWVPMSVNISRGTPPLEKISINASATLSVSMLGNGIASG